MFRRSFVGQKNEQEKEYIKNQDNVAHSQNDLVQQLQEKTDRVNGLKDVYKKQEQVIRKLERLVDNDQLSSLRQQLHASQQRIESLEKQVCENKAYIS